MAGLELAVEIKFGDDGLQLMPEISQIKNMTTLYALRDGLRTSKTLAEWRRIYADLPTADSDNDNDNDADSD
jgi:hypothetical protein